VTPCNLAEIYKTFSRNPLLPLSGYVHFQNIIGSKHTKDLAANCSKCLGFTTLPSPQKVYIKHMFRGLIPHSSRTKYTNTCRKAVKNTTIIVMYKVLVYIQMYQPTTCFGLF